ncbi:BatA domain-containing protein [Cerasicoccus fimbriatus]|uniref:BatA domain-containing protein n=1 Tax=Cerasicoccus fimbriatus TaxID=3014554 RepID=UPI0022B50680|nr:BatA domain-containing protein [Cerasicoccus sp. TK19100]
MTFLNGALLFGASAIAIPILLELLNRTRIEKTKWAAMQFLKKSHEQHQKKLRIEDLLLLLIRCLIILMITLALARPVLPGDNFLGLSSTNAILVIDNSYSMDTSNGVDTRRDRAREAGEAIIDSLPTGSKAAIFLASDDLEPAISVPTQDMSLVRSTLRNYPATSQSTNLASPLTSAIDLLTSDQGAKGELYILTDGQSLGFRDFTQIINTLETAEARFPASMIFLGQGTEPNLGVSMLRPDSELVSTRRPVRFYVEVTNYGNTEARNTNVYLSLNGGAPINDAVIELIEPGQSKVVSMDARLAKDGYHTVTASIPADRLKADDQRSIALQAHDTIDVLLVEGTEARDEKDRSLFFLKNALQPVPDSRKKDFYIQVEEVSAKNFRAANLARADIVVLSDVANLSSALVSSLADFLRNGGGLLIFPGPNTDEGFYNDVLFDEYAILPASVYESEEVAGQVYSFDASQPEHPIPAIFTGGQGSLNTAVFYQRAELVPSAWPPEEERPRLRPEALRLAGKPVTVVSYSDGQPAIMERAYGDGRVVLFGSTADTRWNDFALRAVYLPFLHRAIGYMIQSQDDRLNIRAGQPFMLNLSDSYVDATATVTNIDERDVPFEVVETVELIDGQASLRISDVRLAGGYQVVLNTQPETVLKFAVQFDPTESRPELISDQQKELLSEAVQVVTWEQGADLRGQMQAQRAGTELTGIFILLAFLFLIIETILAQRSSRSR